MSSPDFAEKKMIYDKKYNSYVKNHKNASSADERRKLCVVIKNFTIDFEERSQAEKDRATFLTISFM